MWEIYYKRVRTRKDKKSLDIHIPHAVMCVDSVRKVSHSFLQKNSVINVSFGQTVGYDCVCTKVR